MPGYEATLWLNVSGPAGCRPTSVQRLSVEIGKALQDPELPNNFRAAGVEATAMVRRKLNAFIRAEYEKWGRVVRETAPRQLGSKNARRPRESSALRSGLVIPTSANFSCVRSRSATTSASKTRDAASRGCPLSASSARPGGVGRQCA